MLTSNRLSVADARAIVGLPAVRGSSSSTTDLSPLDQRHAPPASWDGSVPLPVRECGGTLKSRFAALARKSGADRKETRDHGRSLVGRRANLEGRLGDDGDPGRGSHEPLVSPLQRFRKAGRKIVRQGLQHRLQATPDDRKLLGRLGSLEGADGDLENAVEHLRLAAKGSDDDVAWTTLARAEVRAWEQDPATGHERLRWACDAYRRSVDLLEPGFVQVWELPARLLELGGVYESFGSFEGALHIYQRIARSMPLSSGFEDVLFRCAVVMRYMATLERAPRTSLLESALEHLDLIMQEQALRKGFFAESAALLYADVCMALAEGSAVAKGWAKASYQEVFDNRKVEGDKNAMTFRDWDDWIASPETQLRFSKEWSQKGEPALAVLAFEKALEAFGRQKEISPSSKAEPSFSALMDASEAYASFQRFVRQGEQDQYHVVRKALTLQPGNEEAKGLLRELLGDENCRRKEISLQVVLHLQSKWRTRVWQREYLDSLKKCLRRNLEERLAKNRLDMEARDQLAYFFREKHRPVVLYEDRCARVLQRLGRAGLFRLRWFAAKKAAYRTQLTNALKLWQKSGYNAESRAIIRTRASSRYTPQTHKIVSVVALMDSQEEAAPFLQRAARSMLARKMFRKVLKNRARDMRRQTKAAAIRLQCQLRRFFARRELDRRISHAAQRIRAATFIQRVYRTRALQWSYAVKRAQLAHERKIAKAKLGSSIKLQATWRMKQARYEAVVRRRAVSGIQRSTRGFLGRRRAAERKHALVTRTQQRQYRRHRERMVILTALLAIRASREKKEERAREVERRFSRALEEQRLGNTSGSEAIATPLDKRRAERAHKRLLRRIKAKGSSVVRARRLALQKAGKPSSASQPTRGMPPTRSLSPPASRRASTFSTARLLQSDTCNEINRRQSIPDEEEKGIRRISPTGAHVTYQSAAAVLSPEVACPFSAPGASALPAGQETLLSSGSASRLVEDATSSASSHPTTTTAPTSKRPSYGAAIKPKTGACGRSPSRTKLQRSQTSPPPPSSPALKTALKCARGAGGRLGTPLGSPFPAPGEDWAAGRAASAAASAAARISVKLSERAFEPSAPGSRFFPPFGPTDGASDGALCAPVVFEMVQDAADDEEDADGADNDVAGRVRGWHGLTLYRSPGVGQRSTVFQQALQLKTIAFSPDVQTPPLSASPESPRRGSASSRVYGASSVRPQPAMAICHGQPVSCRALACGEIERKGLGMSRWPERGTGRPKRRTIFVRKPHPRPCDELESLEHTRREEREREQQVRDVGGTHFATELHRYGVVKSTPSPPQFTTTKPDGSMSVTPAPLHVASEGSTLFDSGDMIMVAGLLAHPECSLKGLVLHRAKLDTPPGREALLKSLELNKLCRLALGGCVWFDDAFRTDNSRQYEWHTGRWWEKVCDTIRTNAFRLREVVVEGLERGGDALGTGIGTILGDYFAKRFGSLASISLVRCGLSDEGATAVARGIWASSGLSHVDLSANAISDVGVEALAKALVGDYPLDFDEGEKGVSGGHEEPLRSHRPPVIKALDLGQNRITDPGGTALGAALPRSVSLESITLSYNFMMEEAAQALLSAAASSRPTLKEIHCEGNLFDEDVCGHIAQALNRRDERISPPRKPRRDVPDIVSPMSASPTRTGNDWFDRSPHDALPCPRGGERNLARVDVGGSRVPFRTPKVGRSFPGDWRVTGDNSATFPTVAVRRSRKRGHDQAQEQKDEREAVSSSYLAAAIGCPRIPTAAVGAVGSEEETGPVATGY
ncbi:unnamed protein product [Ectocarpus sp. 4 AP-2014]